MQKNFDNLEDAYSFLRKLGATEKLITHVKLVNEAGTLLIKKVDEFGIVFDKQLVTLGIAFHDTGKILHQNELYEKGSNHESAGEILLLENGVNSKIARCCRSHGQWQTMDCSFEELLIALADKLWKGKRKNELEQKVIAEIVKLTHKNPWDVFITMDSCFEKVASDGERRLLRSQKNSNS